MLKTIKNVKFNSATRFMKKKKEIEFDYIGGQEPLTKKEETQLSAFFKEHKLASKAKTKKQIVTKKRDFATV